MKKLESQFRVPNHPLKLQIWESSLKLYVSKKLLYNTFNNLRNCVYLKFVFFKFSQALKNWLFVNIYLRKSEKSIYFTYINFRELRETIHWHAYDFAKIKKIREIRDDLCDVERYPEVILKLQPSTSTFKKTFETQTLEYIFT